MMRKKKLNTIKKELIQLKELSNIFYQEQYLWYGQLRGFKKGISILLQDELDGGTTRELNAIETSNYKITR
jgi:hypothetical protein